MGVVLGMGKKKSRLAILVTINSVNHSRHPLVAKLAHDQWMIASQEA
jgi:hypothetical protein